ncbi:MAG: glycosyltransferase [Rhodospirillaceae bacterium]|nr:glycosyltransferase [Rhodospirillaceae bacterium]
MNVLFVHRDFPGQFGAIAERFSRSSHHRVAFISSASNVDAGRILHRSARPRRRPAPTTHHYLHGFEADVLLGQAVYEAGWKLRQEGFVPDVILAHCGWGVTLYLREAFPKARLIGYFEWYYSPHNSDADYLDPAGMTADKACRIRTRNAPILMALEDVDFGLVPTDFQRSRFPRSYHHKLQTLHDGVDTEFFSPPCQVERAGRFFDFATIPQVITYATRGLEPYRGFPEFMQATSALLERDKTVHVAVAGEDKVFYSRALPNGETYREKMTRELVNLDPARVHFLGTLPREDYRKLLQLSSVHVYLTVPFVPSWSLVEAMACGCNIVASDTEPVREVLGGEAAARLVDHRDIAQLEKVMRCALTEQEAAQGFRSAARNRAKSAYSSADLLPIWEAALSGEPMTAATNRSTEV